MTNTKAKSKNAKNTKKTPVTAKNSVTVTSKKAPAPSISKRVFGVLATVAVVAALLIAIKQPLTDDQLLLKVVEESLSKQTSTVMYRQSDPEGGAYVSTYDLDYSDPTNVLADGNVELRSDMPSEAYPALDMDVVIPGDGLTYVRVNTSDNGMNSIDPALLGNWYSLTDERVRGLNPGEADLFAQTVLFGAYSTVSVAHQQGQIPDGNLLMSSVASCWHSSKIRTSTM